MNKMVQNNSIYVIVHEVVVAGVKLGSHDPSAQAVFEEIERIKREEDFIEVRGLPYIIPHGLSHDKDIKVCGAYYGKESVPLCVGIQLDAIRKAGYDATLHETGTLILDT